MMLANHDSLQLHETLAIRKEQIIGVDPRQQQITEAHKGMNPILQGLWPSWELCHRYRANVYFAS